MKIWVLEQFAKPLPPHPHLRDSQGKRLFQGRATPVMHHNWLYWAAGARTARWVLHLSACSARANFCRWLLNPLLRATLFLQYQYLVRVCEALIPLRSRAAPAHRAAWCLQPGPPPGTRGSALGGSSRRAGFWGALSTLAGWRAGSSAPSRWDRRGGVGWAALGVLGWLGHPRQPPGAPCASGGAEQECPQCPVAVPPWLAWGAPPGPLAGGNGGWTGRLCWCGRWDFPVPLQPQDLHQGFGGAGEVAALRRDVLRGLGGRSMVGPLGLAEGQCGGSAPGQDLRAAPLCQAMQ